MRSIALLIQVRSKVPTNDYLLFLPYYSLNADPLNGIKHRSRQRDLSPSPAPIPMPMHHSSSSTSSSKDKNAKLMRERSIKTNRRHKFVECLSCGDVSISSSPFAYIHSILNFFFL
jgi:hypothetical protein